MSLRKRVGKRQTERMSDTSFRIMHLAFKIVDFFYPYINKRVKKFGIEKGMTVVDYGCGPGRYATKIAEIVGENGKVYALDIHELAIEAVKSKIIKYDIANIEPVLIREYDSTLPDDIADVVYAIDMFFMIREPAAFLGELRRIVKKDGRLVIDDGHQPRTETKNKILDSGFWDIIEETKDHLKCKSK